MTQPDKPARSHLDGILVIDKPYHLSSMRAVAIVRRRAGGIRTGHAGTLDPLATGVLIIALGRATKSVEALMATTKRYRTVIDLSAVTESHDLESPDEIVEIDAIPARDAIERALARFRGSFEQRPPRHSAVQIGGRRAYEFARRGKVIELAPRVIRVHDLVLVNYDWPRAEFDIRCDKGFYVRSFARDLGEALGTGGYCASIERTAVGPFTIDQAIALDDVPDPLREAVLIPVERALELVRDFEVPRRSAS